MKFRAGHTPAAQRTRHPLARDGVVEALDVDLEEVRVLKVRMERSDVSARLVMVEVRWKLDAAEMSDDTASFAHASFSWNEDEFTAMLVLVLEILDHGS